MEETSKLNPRIDDQLKHETAPLTHGAGVDSRARDEFRQQDPVDLPNPADRPDLPDPGGSGIPIHDVDQRAELARVIGPAQFPARRDDLLAVAQGEHAPGVLLGALRSLAADEEFANVQAVWAALGGGTEGPHS